MAEPIPQIFNKRATERLRNPEDLDKYLRVTNPSVWVVLLACIALLAGLLIWAIFGTIEPNVKAYGARVNGQTICIVTPESIGKLNEGDQAMVNGVPMTVDDVSATPISRDEARTLLGNDYLVATLMSGDWAYVVSLTGDVSTLPEGAPLETTITVERIAPITLVLGGKK